MKIKFFNFVFKRFSNKVVNISPSLLSKNPPKGVYFDKITPISNLLKSQKLSENKNEAINISEKYDYEKLILEYTQKIHLHYYETNINLVEYLFTFM